MTPGMQLAQLTMRDFDAALSEDLDGLIAAAEPDRSGTINLDALRSTPYWQPQVVPPKDAPNVLLILTDDVGFAAPSTFGGAGWGWPAVASGILNFVSSSPLSPSGVRIIAMRTST